jgi:hypothetical protein
MKEAVAVRPDWSDTACKWGSEQLKRKTIAYAAQAGWQVKDLYADDAVKTKIIQELLKASYGSLLGHGNETIYTAQRKQVVFQVGDTETLEFCKNSTERGLNFLSCLVGKQLLPWMTAQGLKFAKGYTEEFVFAYEASNFPDSTAEPFFLAYCEFDRVYFETQDELKAFDAELGMWENAIDESDSTTKRYKVQDYNSCNLFKDGKAVPRPPTKPQCQVSAWIADHLGYGVLKKLRAIRKALFGIEPAYP